MATRAASIQQGLIATQALFFIRSVQQTSIILTGFIAAYFVYWHNALRDPVPLQLIELLTACALIYLENFALSLYTLINRDASPNYRNLLTTSSVFSLALGVEIDRLRTIPSLKNWAKVDDWFRPIRESEGYELKPAGVEQHHQALVCVLMVTLLVAFTATMLIFGFAVVGIARPIVMERIRKRKQQGYAMVGEIPDDDDDTETICGLEDMEKRS